MSPPANGCTTHVLVVDDDDGIREAARLLLEEEGYTVTEAADGVECMDALLLSPHRLVVLLDVMMPNMSGFDVLDWVVSHQDLLARHGYIVISAALPFVSAKLAERFGHLPLAVLRKPFDIEELLATVALVASGQRPPTAVHADHTGNSTQHDD